VPVYLVPMADVESLVTNSLPGVTQLLRALAESAFQVSEAECAEKQQVGKEKIRGGVLPYLYLIRAPPVLCAVCCAGAPR
jgi:hypothetical protein